ncbi:carbohydrate ABC transporter permease [Cohnella sp. GCM10027633]|uniref:carbohydrate ABC transporter permease n=1 Tax=unclassified Cohnella TaxID=2636738 RepID=UPI00363C6E4A
MKTTLEDRRGTAVATYRIRFSPVKTLIHVWFILVSVCMVAPMALVLSASFSDDGAIRKHGYRFWPETFSAKAYEYIFQSPAILLKSYGVTTFVTVVGTLISLVLTAMLGYVISRKAFRYHKIATGYIFFTVLFSGGVVPFYILITQYLHMQNTIWVLIIPHVVFPLYVLVMRSFMLAIPGEIFESAKIDGAKEFRIFFRIVLPLSAPALATLGLFFAFKFWNDWFPAMLFINDESYIPIQLLLVRMMENLNYLTSDHDFITAVNVNAQQFPTLSARMAMALLAAGPMMFIFPFFQRYFVTGLTFGSLKG